MDIKRLHAFVRVVDIGSITRASNMLRIAQPALSQQITALEHHFGKPLLLRSKRGVVPTEAGRIFYRHCQRILKQMEQAELDVSATSEAITGFVSVAMAPLSLGSLIAVQLMTTIRNRHPGIVLHINENVGGVISELVMTGKTDVALIFDPGTIPSLSFQPVTTEELYFVTRGPGDPQAGDAEVTLAEAVAAPLVLPRRIHTIRTATVVAETESISLLAGALAEGLGNTILPRSAAFAVQRRLASARLLRIRKPNMKVSMAICVSGQLPLSEPAVLVRDQLILLAQEFASRE
jgi:LysR family nitrogen assimilation transcriptional regulator